MTNSHRTTFPITATGSIYRLVIVLIACTCFYSSINGQETPATDAAAPQATAESANRPSVMRLKNGDFVEGNLVPSSNVDRVGWKSPLLSAPIQIPITAIRSLELNQETTRSDNAIWSIELKNGDRTSGNIVRWDEKELELTNEAIGSVVIPTVGVGRVLQSSPDMKWIFEGPRDASVWKPFSGDTPWTIQGGALVSDQIGSRVIGNVGLPTKSSIDIRVSWDGKPGFVLAFGVDGNASNINSAFRIETWQNQLVLLRQAKGKAEITELENLDETQQFLDLSLFLDQQAERMVVYSGRGKLIGDLTMPSQSPTTHSAMAVANHSENFRIERVRVREWTMPLPADRANDASYILKKDGEAVTGSIIAGSQEKGWTLKAAEATVTIPWLDVTEIIQQDKKIVAPENDASNAKATESAKAGTSDKSSESFEELLDAIKEGNNIIANDNSNRKSTDNDKTQTGAANVPTSVQVELTDGSRWRGQWLRFEGTNITLQPESSSSSVKFDIKHLGTLRGSSDAYKAAEKIEGRIGVLIGTGLQLEGMFATSNPTQTESVLSWFPTGAAGPVDVLNSLNGRIDFRGRSRRQRDPATSDSQVDGIAVQAQLNFGRGGDEEAKPTEKRFSLKQLLVPSIVLRSGETFAASIESVNDSGITFSSEMYTATSLPNSEIQSVELRRVKSRNIPTLKKVDRLLTVPRSSKNDPPTHVLISTEGDFLRGRLISLNSEFALIEVRLEQVKVPLDKVAQVVWLHDRQWKTAAQKPTSPEDQEASDSKSDDAEPTAEAKEEKAGETAANEISAGQLVAIFRNGLRLAVNPSSATPTQVMGNNRLLGECRIPINEVDMLLLGPKANEQATQMVENPWKLTLAKSPMEPAEGGGGGSNGGNQSPLVGQAAPEIELQTADGESFKLSGLKGKVVVLDFWASWCGPCMQTMPKVDEIVGEAPADAVQLIAINLEEPAERAKAALDRLKLKTKIVLDIDGVAAQKYQAAAIPQTVIIDRDGTIQQVFVGGGEQFLKNFREALKTAIEAPSK